MTMKEHRKNKESDSFGVNSSLTFGQHIEAGSFTSPLTKWMLDFQAVLAVGNVQEAVALLAPVLLGLHGSDAKEAV